MAFSSEFVTRGCFSRQSQRLSVPHRSLSGLLGLKTAPCAELLKHQLHAPFVDQHIGFVFKHQTYSRTEGGKSDC